MLILPEVCNHFAEVNPQPRLTSSVIVALNHYHAKKVAMIAFLYLVGRHDRGKLLDV